MHVAAAARGWLHRRSMIVVVPLVWLVLWFVIGGVVGVYSGVAPKGSGLAVFLVVFLGGAFGLPVLAWVGRRMWLAFGGRNRA